MIAAKRLGLGTLNTGIRVDTGGVRRTKRLSQMASELRKTGRITKADGTFGTAHRRTRNESTEFFETKGRTTVTGQEFFDVHA